MKKLLLSGLVLMAAIAVLNAQSAGSTRDGIFTLAQAKRGQLAYSQHCMECHGRELEGDVETRPLAGDEFTNNWVGNTVGGLFDRIRITMPANKAGTLDRQTVADILAFVLLSNEYPAGKTELTTRSELLQLIKFELPK